MEKEMKMYHVETQEDYDDLMIKLEEQGYKWISGDKPTNKPEYWGDRKENTTVLLNRFQNYRMTRGALDYHKRTYPFTTVIKHKAKGVKQMEKLVVPRCVADWYEEYGSNDLHKTLDRYLNNEGTSNELVQWEKSFGGTHRNNLNNAQDILAKMHLYDYEVEEKKYHWRKKKEYMFSFDKQENSYLNVNKETGDVFFGTKVQTRFFQTLLTETQVRQAVIEEDFNKLERVEIDAK